MNITDDLERLSRLHKDGSLSDVEFVQAKSRVISQRDCGEPALKGISFHEAIGPKNPATRIVGVAMIIMFALIVFVLRCYH